DRGRRLPPPGRRRACRPRPERRGQSPPAWKLVTDYPSPRALLDKYGFRAKKSWGQNFLIDPRIHEAIARAAVAAPDDWVVEIGAGLGTLTARLAAAAPAGRVLAVERDRDMVQVLEAELGTLPNVEV